MKVLSRKVFSSIYTKHGWSGHSISGRGSEPDATSVLSVKLEALIKDFKIKSILDLGCGDANWITKINLSGARYCGMDTVKPLIRQNILKYPGYRFVVGDPLIGKELPKVDLVVCRDCLVHLCLEDVWIVKNKIKKSGSTYCLLTTFSERITNSTIMTGQWHPMNLEIPPYNFEQPLYLLNEECKQYKGKYSDKCLGLWECYKL